MLCRRVSEAVYTMQNDDNNNIPSQSRSSSLLVQSICLSHFLLLSMHVPSSQRNSRELHRIDTVAVVIVSRVTLSLRL